MMDAEDDNNNAAQQPNVELAGSRSSLGDFSQQEAADQAVKKKRKYIIGGSIGIIVIILAIVLGVTLSGSGSNNNNTSNNTNNEEQSNVITDSEPTDNLTQEPNVGEEPIKPVVVDPTIFSINDDTATYFTNGKSFNVGFTDTDNAVYIDVLDNDSSGGENDLVVTSIKESTFGPKHGECIISMGLDEVVYELNDFSFTGEDQCTYEACTNVEESQECGTAIVRIKIEQSEDAQQEEVTDPSKLIPLDDISSEATQLLIDEGIDSREAVVDIYDDTIVVGMSYDNLWKGTVLVFVKDTNGEWTQEAKLVAPDMYEEYQGYFGFSVDIDKNTLIVGAWGDSDPDNEVVNRGAAHIFVRENGEWSHQAKLMAEDGKEGNLYLGYDVTVSGDVAVATSWWANEVDGITIEPAGSAYVWMRDGDTWSFIQKLESPDGENDDPFGNSVDMYGNTMIIGAWFDDNEETDTTDSGSAHIFARNGDTFVWQAKLQDANSDAEDRFGNRVAIYEDTAVVGARGDDSDDGADSGSVYIFERTGDSWTRTQKLVAPDSAVGDKFGNSISIFGDHLIIGARHDDDIGSDSGAVHVYVRPSNVEPWKWMQKVLHPEGLSGDVFGWSASIYDDQVVVGSQSGDILVYSDYTGERR